MNLGLLNPRDKHGNLNYPLFFALLILPVLVVAIAGGWNIARSYQQLGLLQSRGRLLPVALDSAAEIIALTNAGITLAGTERVRLQLLEKSSKETTDAALQVFKTTLANPRVNSIELVALNDASEAPWYEPIIASGKPYVGSLTESGFQMVFPVHTAEQTLIGAMVFHIKISENFVTLPEELAAIGERLLYLEDQNGNRIPLKRITVGSNMDVIAVSEAIPGYPFRIVLEEPREVVFAVRTNALWLWIMTVAFFIALQAFIIHWVFYYFKNYGKLTLP